MSDLLPIIEQLADCKTHTARAHWLLACPVLFLRRYDTTIRNRLYLAGFPIGVAYLDDMAAHLCATRDPATGAFRPETQEAVAMLGTMLLAKAFVMDGGGPEPDHSITEL